MDTPGIFYLHVRWLPCMLRFKIFEYECEYDSSNIPVGVTYKVPVEALKLVLFQAGFHHEIAHFQPILVPRLGWIQKFKTNWCMHVHSCSPISGCC